MRRLGLVSLIGVVALLALLAASGGAAANSLSLVEAGSVGFPQRAFVLTAAKPIRLDPRSVQVLENGEQVHGLTVVPSQSAAGGSFGVVLAIDASLSMEGKPIKGALAAARAFAGRRAVNQALGIVTFNGRVYVPLSPTTDAGQIDRELSSPPALAAGTRMFDAVDQAITLLRKQGFTVGAVAVLSDGADTGSGVNAAQVAAAAQAAHVRVFTIGLRSRQFRSATLRKLASATGAGYSEAGSPSALKRIFRGLSQQLSNEYLVQYESTAKADTLVRVEVSVLGVNGTARALYRTPALPTKSGAAPYHRPFADRFWLSPASMLLVSLAAGLLAALALAGILQVGGFGLRRRMREFVSMRETSPRRDQLQRSIERTAEAVERSLAGRGWWERFKEELEVAEFPMPAGRLALATAAASLGLAFFSGVLLPPVFIVFGLGLPPLVARVLVRRKLAAKREAFMEQLPDNLTVLASALRAGHSFVGALSVMVNETDEPSRKEFNRALADEQLGVPVEEALHTVSRRMANDDLEQVALVAALQRQTGGNTAEVLDTVVDTIRERFDVRRTLGTLTAQGRMTRWILTALPILIFALITAINPHYMAPLFDTATGQAMLALAVVMVLAGSVAIRRILDIKV